MKKIIQTSIAIAALTLGFSTEASALTQITSSMDFGQRGTSVRNLQEFLAMSPDIYPQGLVTGYFGILTRAAVMNFQAKYGIVSSGTAATTGYGRVGPITLARINSIILTGGMGGGTSTGDSTGLAIALISAPTITSSTATFNWSTNKLAYGRVYYSTSTLKMIEGDINSVGFAIINGQVSNNDSVARNYQSATITGLQPNTNYYYTIVATDLAGNVSIIGPNNTFRTNATSTNP